MQQNPRFRREFIATIEALATGDKERPCLCPSHLGIVCKGAGCCCPRHEDRFCSGTVSLVHCPNCGIVLESETSRVVIACGCTFCNKCAIDNLMGQSFTQGMGEEELLGFFTNAPPGQAEIVRGLIREKIATGLRGQEGTQPCP